MLMPHLELYESVAFCSLLNVIKSISFKRKCLLPLVSLIKVQWRERERERDEDLIVTCICPLCVAVVDRDQTVNPRVSVPDFGPTCLARWRKNIKHTCYHLHLCANTISWKLALERDLRAECLFISTEARVPSLRKRDCVCGLPVRLRVARDRSATFIAAISDKNGEKDVKMLWTSVQSRVWVVL